MNRPVPTDAMEELLAQTGWLRRLALSLAGDADVADDVVQDTWLAAMRRTPDTREPVRPWLAKVARNALRMRIRGEGRRTAREKAADLMREDVPTPASLVAKTEAQRELAGLVLRLDEPYRSTVLLHFGEGRSLADIARAQGIAPSTARGRLKTALGQLREWLDVDADDRRHWVIAPLLALPKGAVVAQKTSKAVAAVVILLMLLLGALVFLWSRSTAGPDGASTGQAVEPRGPGSRARTAGDGPADKPDGPAWLAQAGIAPKRIAGRVTFQGAPVPGATVILAGLASESGLVEAPRLTTDASGRFDFGLRPALEWSVRASAPGKTGKSLAVDLRSPVNDPRPDQLELALGACDAALVGTVRDASGGPVVGARVARLPLTGQPPVPGGVAAFADDQGAYELCVEWRWPGRVKVEVSADGYGAVGFVGLVLGRVDVDFELVPEATMVGRVVRDETGDPVPAAHVYIDEGRGGIEWTAWRGTFTDDDGRFRLVGAAPGRHVLRARAEGMVGVQAGTPVVVAAGETTQGIEIRLAAGSVVRGVVQQDGKPVAGARVSAVATDGVVSGRTAVSQEDGSFSLEEVPRGQVRFHAWPYDVVAPTSFAVERSRHDGLVLDVESLGTIVGRAVRHGQPVAGAQIYIHGPNERELDEVRTDDGGRFVAPGLQPGPWVLFAEDSRSGSFGRAPETVDLGRGETKEVTIELVYGAAISGRVVDQDANPVSGVTVMFTHTKIDDVGIAVTATDGTFRAATMMGGGEYRSMVRPYQGSVATLQPAVGSEFPTIALADGSSEVSGVVLAVQMDRLSILGRVIDTSGAPVSDVRVAVTPVREGVEPRFFQWIRYATTTSDTAGGFSIGDLPAGDYAIQARSASGAEATMSGIRAGQRGVTVTLPAPGAIDGTLVGFNRPPEVAATRMDLPGVPAPTAAAVSQDTFRIDSLAPGRYALVARGSKATASATVEVEPGATTTATLVAADTGSVVGRVVEFQSRRPVEGMTCHAETRVGMARVGDRPEASGGTHSGSRRSRSGADGGFEITAPAGDIVVACAGLWRLYSDGLRIATLGPSQRLEIDVPVVAGQVAQDAEFASFGGVIEVINAVVPRFVQVAPRGPAAAAGFLVGDQVVAIDGVSVESLSPGGVVSLLIHRSPGTTVRLSVVRDGQRITSDLTLGSHNVR